jgi:hypothetical protein
LLIRHAFASLTGRSVIARSAGRSSPTRGMLDYQNR